MPQGQKRAVWIWTGNLSLLKRTALTIEPRLHISDNIKWNIAVYVVELLKKNCNWENMLERVVAACQLWCRASQWRCDLGTLMKYVCKVLIYHPPKNWHSIMILCCCSRLWMLGSSTPSESKIINTFGWLPSHNWRRSNTKMVLENDYNRLQNMLSSLSITSVTWSFHMSPIACWLEPALSLISLSLWNIFR